MNFDSERIIFNFYKLWIWKSSVILKSLKNKSQTLKRFLMLYLLMILN